MTVNTSAATPDDQRADDARIAAAAADFWLVVSTSFPEVTTGDSQITGEDEAAFALWANGDPGDRSDRLHEMALPEGVGLDRVQSVTNAAIEAAKDGLFRGRSVPDLPEHTLVTLRNCVHHMLHFNYPEPTYDGYFELSIYDTRETWESGKGPSEYVNNIADIDEAFGLMHDPKHENAFQVTIRAFGNHMDYEPGETVAKLHEITGEPANAPAFRKS